MTDLFSIINSVALLLSFIGFAITIYQLRSSAKDSKKLSNINDSLEGQLDVFEGQNKELSVIKESLSTKYLGQFPDFVNTTIDIIGKAERKIEIACDFPCYSYFSNHLQYVDYKNKLETKSAEGKSIHLICPDSNYRRRLVKKQFKASDDLTNDSWKQIPEIENKLRAFIKNENISKKFEDFTINDFNDRVDQLNRMMLDFIFKNSEVYEVNRQLPVYYWIVDEAIAVFSIPSYTEYDREQGFITSDAKLINGLRTINTELKS